MFAVRKGCVHGGLVVVFFRLFDFTSFYPFEHDAVENESKLSLLESNWH